MTLTLIVNADDFGVSPGVNEAIVAAFKNGVLNSTSIIINAAHADAAVRLAAENPDLNVGVHLNLTRQQNQRPLANPVDIPLLVDRDGLLRHGFVGLLRESLLRPRALGVQVEREMRAQIEKVLSSGIKPTHLDSHRHVHAIPVLFRAVKKLADEYGIARVRVVNENLAATLRAGGEMRGFFDGGLIKHLVLRTLFRINRADGDVYFYSIFHTTRLFGPNLRRIHVPARYNTVELGTHPCAVATDAAAWDSAFADYLLSSPDRQREFEALLDKELPQRIVQA